MTLDDHNKTLGILYLVYTTLHTGLLALLLSIFGGVIYTLTHQPGRDAPPFTFFLVILGIIFAFALLILAPPFVAGVGLLKRKRWARTAGIIAAILMALNAPFGTALSIYSFWFLFGKGERLYRDEFADFARYSLNDAPPRPASEWTEREREYATPQPPDWRS
jgi:hypothetical protein